jgi:organic radical activating enzyme
MLYPINEIFYSIQGEGYWMGRPAVFVRMAGCNLRCQYCDTQHLEIKEELNEHQILKKVLKLFPSRSNIYPRVIVTGGEPTLYDLEPLAKLFIMSHVDSALETNGTNFDKWRRFMYFDWITVSPKLDAEYTNEYKHKRVNELKVVYDLRKEPHEYLEYFLPIHKFVQPMSEQFKPAIKYVKENPEWRLSLQTHKILNIR